jgi:hypothetical protein
VGIGDVDDPRPDEPAAAVERLDFTLAAQHGGDASTTL